jgi:hypothetical protein
MSQDSGPSNTSDSHSNGLSKSVEPQSVAHVPDQEQTIDEDKTEDLKAFIKTCEGCLRILLRDIDEQRTLIGTVAASITSLTNEHQELHSLSARITQDICHFYRKEVYSSQTEELMNDQPPLLVRIWPKGESDFDRLVSAAEEIKEEQLAVEDKISKWTLRLTKIEEQQKWNREATSAALRQLGEVSSSLPSIDVDGLEEFTRLLTVPDLSAEEKVMMCSAFAFVGLKSPFNSENGPKEKDEGGRHEE